MVAIFTSIIDNIITIAKLKSPPFQPCANTPAGTRNIPTKIIANVSITTIFIYLFL